MTKVTAYKCSFCKTPKLYLSQQGCKKHEKRCWLNPARRSCATCVNVYRLDGAEIIWKCQSIKEATPFKGKIDKCPMYSPSGDIFDNEA